MNGHPNPNGSDLVLTDIDAVLKDLMRPIGGPDTAAPINPYSGAISPGTLSPVGAGATPGIRTDAGIVTGGNTPDPDPAPVRQRLELQPDPTAVSRRRPEAPVPEPAAEDVEQVIDHGDHGDQGEEAEDAAAADELPEGVLPTAGPVVAGLTGVVGGIAAAEAGYNVFAFTHTVLDLPLVLAIAFPFLFEATATSFALQDMRDRRRGVESKGLQWATYITLGFSAVIGGIVGVVMHGAAGLLAAVAPIALGFVIHLHGERATRAYRSRARRSKTWRAEQQRAAETESARDVLPLLLPDDVHGRATSALLNRRMDAGTLTPGGALIAAGWHQRAECGLSDSQLRRLEVVAATVWGETGAPVAAAPARRSSGSGSGAPRRNRTAGSGSGTGAPNGGTGAGTGSGAPGGGGSGAPVTSRRRLSDAELAAEVAEHHRRSPADGETKIRTALNEAGYSASNDRIRPVLKALKAKSAARPSPKGGDVQ